MKIRGLLIGVILAMVAVYLVFFTKVAKDEKGGLEIMVDKYLQAKIDLTGVNLEALSREVLSYAADGRGLPEKLSDLRGSHPTAGSLPDAWGKTIRYKKLSEESFRLASAGPDGVFGTKDDIVKDF